MAGELGLMSAPAPRVGVSGSAGAVLGKGKAGAEKSAGEKQAGCRRFGLAFSGGSSIRNAISAFGADSL